MSEDRLSREEQMVASRQAQHIQRIVNTAMGRRFVRCVGPLRFRPRDASGPTPEVHFGVEMRVEPFVAIADFREQPGQKMAAALREWAALLNRAADSLG